MFYKPQLLKETGFMWDTWLYWYKGPYYLYYLVKSGEHEHFDNISLAISDDGVYWKEHGVILTKSPDAVWMGTGSIWTSLNFEEDGKFFLNLSEWRGNQQTIYFAESTDLIHWTRLGDKSEFKPDARWYNVDQRENSRWDCIFTTPRKEGGLWGYWTASPSAYRGVGFGYSEDGFTWRALEPPKIEPPLQVCCEHGAVAKVGETYYHLLGMLDMNNAGMYTYVADKPQGPLRRAKKNAGLLTSGDETMNGRKKVYTYFARFFHAPDGLLVNHHTCSRHGVYLGLLKRAVFSDDGTLSLGWWEGNDRLKVHRVAVNQSLEVENSAPRMLKEVFNADDGFILEAMLEVSSDRKKLTGLYIETGKDQGDGIFVRPAGVTDFGPFQKNYYLIF